MKMNAAKTFEVHGHRGARARLPENTMESFRYALDLGVDAIEIDIALSAERTPLVMHDRALNAKLYRWTPTATDKSDFATNCVLVKELSVDRIQELDIGALPHSEFPEQTQLPGARVPTLDQFVELMMAHPSAAILNLEIKTHPFLTEEAHSAEDFVTAILEVLVRHRVPYSRVLFQSFDPRALFALKSADPKWRASFLTDAWTEDVPEVAVELGVEAVSPRWDLLTTERVAQIRAQNLGLYVWTANTPAEWKLMAAFGVDGIISDDPVACLAFRNSLPAPTR